MSWSSRRISGGGGVVLDLEKKKKNQPLLGMKEGIKCQRKGIILSKEAYEPSSLLFGGPCQGYSCSKSGPLRESELAGKGSESINVKE